LLEGELEPAPPPQSHPPPPVATPPSREAVSPPPLRPAAFEAEEAKGRGYVPGRCANCGGRFEFPSASAGKVILCPHCRHPIPLVPLPALSLSPVMSSKELGEPAQAIHRASHLHEHVGDRLRQTAARTGRPLVSVPPPRRTTTSTEVIDTVGMLRHSRSARQLMIAAVVLGPPRGLERYT
jgi:DNA-directed RNA polymerase subunit RPC12/RpoP